MSPLMDTPATRRDALAGFGALFLALLGMPQFLQDTEATDAPPLDVEQPAPSSSRSWSASWELCAQDDHLPVPRALELETTLVFDGRELRMDVVWPPDPVWVNGIEQPGMELGSFVFTGNPAAFLDEISSDADGEWLRKQMRWAQRPFTWCPACMLAIDKKPTCENCNGTGWIHFTPEEGRRMVEKNHAERQALIDAAWEGHELPGIDEL
jgi:hypothetical protein